MELDLIESESVTTVAVKISSRQQYHMWLVDLPSRDCAALSSFADKRQHAEGKIGLRGPLVGCQAVQSLTYELPPLW